MATVPEGDAIIAEEIAAATATAESDPAPSFKEPDAPNSDPAPDAPKRRGRPPGSKNATSGTRGRKSSAAKLDEIGEAFGTAIERAADVATYVVAVSPLAPEQKIVWYNDASIVKSPKGKEALVGSLRFACSRNSRIARFCESAIEASAYTGIGAAVVFGLIVPIAINHGLIKLPPQLAGMFDVGDSVPVEWEAEQATEATPE